MLTCDTLGNERDYIIVSLVRTRGLGFLDDHRRTNVMLTRCKRGMVTLFRRPRRRLSYSLGLSRRIINQLYYVFLTLYRRRVMKYELKVVVMRYRLLELMLSSDVLYATRCPLYKKPPNECAIHGTRGTE